MELPPGQVDHTRIQQRLMKLLESRIDSSLYDVTKEFPFRPEPDVEVWVADVALFHISVFEQMPGEDWYLGVPPMVIEVLSPSNTASEMLDRETICLQNGGLEFWLVDPKRRTVKLTRADGTSSIHDFDSSLSSSLLKGTVPVRQIFES